MKIYLVRHGQSTGNVTGTMLGWGDHGLTARGRAEASAVAARLKPLGPMPVHCSDLPRTRQTAEIIAAGWRPPHSPPRVLADERLREIDLGEFDGRSWDEFNADEALAAAFACDLLGTYVPGGESLGEVAARVIAAFNDVVASAAMCACIVGHDGTIRAIVNHILNVPPERYYSLQTAHGGLSLLETGDDMINLTFLNDTSHLDGLADGRIGAADLLVD
jgi:broad specificity phosphatase PhoE